MSDPVLIPDDHVSAERARIQALGQRALEQVTALEQQCERLKAEVQSIAGELVREMSGRALAEEQLRQIRSAVAGVDLRGLDAMEAEARGLGRASCFLFVQSAGFPVDDPRRQAFEWAAAELDLQSQDMRAQKGAA